MLFCPFTDRRYKTEVKKRVSDIFPGDIDFPASYTGDYPKKGDPYIEFTYFSKPKKKKFAINMNDMKPTRESRESILVKELSK